MLFKVPLLIADISAAMTLEPGDIIATGTPEGVGAGLSAGMAVAGRRGGSGSHGHRPAASSCVAI
jgi:2-keto-4-pentenoate hydratase/2-oxohepta-3-ene-1,7-dioic acid hydratase in catechol pathway